MAQTALFLVLALALGAVAGECALAAARWHESRRQERHTAGADGRRRRASTAEAEGLQGAQSVAVGASPAGAASISRTRSFRIAFDAVGAATFCALAWRIGASAELAQAFVVAFCLMVLSATDLDALFIPNSCVAAMVVARLAYLLYASWALGADALALVGPSLVGGAVTAAAMALLAWVAGRVTKTTALGAGDVKLLFAVGMLFGVRGSVLVVLVACVAGLAFDAVRRARGGAGGPIPFGPAVAFGCLAFALFGPQAIVWYEGLFL